MVIGILYIVLENLGIYEYKYVKLDKFQNRKVIIKKKINK